MAATPDQVREWIKAEDKNAVATVDEKLEWGLTARFGSIAVDIRQPKGAPHIVVQSAIAFSPEHQKQYDALFDDGKRALVTSLRARLAAELPDFRVDTDRRPVLIAIMAFLYPEDLTRQLLMDRVRKVHHLAAAVSFHVQDYFYVNNGVQP